MSRKKRSAHRAGLHLVLERSTVAIVTVCFVLYNVVVFAIGYVSGVSANREPNQPGAVRPMAPIATPVQPVAAQEALRAPDTTAFVTTSQFAYMSLPELYRTLVREGGNVDDVLATERRVGAVPDRSASGTDSELQAEMTVDSRRYAVQLGSYALLDDARDMEDGVRAIGYDPEVVRSITSSGEPVYLLILSRHHSLSEAEEAAGVYRTATGTDAIAVPYRRSASYRDAHR